MIELSSFLLFVGAALFLLITPGPAVVYIAARSVEQGSRAGLVASAGMATGGLLHVLAAAFGLSALLASSAAAFAAVQYAGAAYLLVLGARTLLRGRTAADPAAVERKSLGCIFSESVVVQVLNPKTALFFFAFLPQFVDPAAGRPLPQVLILGATFVTLALLTDSAYALFAGTFARCLRSGRRMLDAQRWVAGSVYLLLGLATAVSGGVRK